MRVLPASCLQSPGKFMQALELVIPGESVVLEFQPFHLTKSLMEWHEVQYPWHHKDTIRSYTEEKLRRYGNNGKRKDFGYMHRAVKYFGYHQFDEHRVQPNKLICMWDPSFDGDNFGEHNPCLVLVRFKRVKHTLNMVAVYRKRDMLTRMVGNLKMLVKWLTDEAKIRRLKPGSITDFSMESQLDKSRLSVHMMRKGTK